MKRLALMILLLPILLFGLWKLASHPGLQLFGELVSRVDTKERAVALTFDDGPTTRPTEQLLEVLEERDVAATFFLVGEAMDRRPEIVRRIVAAGHQVANHSWSHRRMLLKRPGFLRRELDKTDALLRDAGYGGEIVFRPPYGKKGVLLPWLLSARGTTSVTWDLAPESELGPGASAEALVDHVREHVRPGSIILLHVMFPGREASLEAVPGLIDALRGDGYRFVTVNELRTLGAADTAEPQ